jgi:ankyrin repeat protein
MAQITMRMLLKYSTPTTIRKQAAGAHPRGILLLQLSKAAAFTPAIMIRIRPLTVLAAGDCPPRTDPTNGNVVIKNGEQQHNQHMDLPAQEFAMGCHFLHQVALGMPLSVLAAILRERPSLVNFRDYDRRSPLHVAASEGHLSICEFLVVENGAIVNRSDRWGGSPLDDAHRHRHVHITKFLLTHGAVSGSPSQSNCFITAASEGDLDEVQAFLDLGHTIIDVNQGDYDQRTALHLAAAGGHTAIVQLLCDTARANVNVQDRWGHRPLDDAKRSGHVSCVTILEQFGAKHGHSVATAAASALLGKEALYDLMVKHGKIRGGSSNETGALSMDWHDVKELLLDVGEDPTDEVVQKLFTVADLNGTGVIDTDEFIAHSELFLGGRPARIILVVGGPGTCYSDTPKKRVCDSRDYFSVCCVGQDPARVCCVVVSSRNAAWRICRRVSYCATRSPKGPNWGSKSKRY